MDNIRVTLAVVALGLGVLLLIIAFIRSLRKKAPATANWVFSALFLAVGFVLWLRSSDPSMSNFPVTSDSITKDVQVEEEDVNTGEHATHGKSSGSTRQSSSSESSNKELVENEQSSRSSLTENERLTTKSSKQPEYSRSIPRSTVPYLQHQRRARPAEDLDWEDRIFAAIDASFDWIEEFFEEYATPVAASRPAIKQPQKIEQPDIAFPEIRFNDGTAELTSDSQVELKILATRLTAEYPKANLEIQAYVDSVGPEAFNFVLTQARADAIRDLLVAEGVEENRIIAKGYGTGDNPEFADSRIEFIVRN